MTTLVELPLRDFISSLASESPAPGGGSASAAAGAAGAALLGMVARLTLGKEKYREAWPEMESVADRTDEIRKRLLELVDEDTRAYQAIVASRKLPKGTPEEQGARKKAIDAATVLATAVPMQTASFAEKALTLSRVILEKGNQNAVSDLVVGTLLLMTAVEGALANVRINLSGITDEELALGFRQDAEDLAKNAHDEADRIRNAAKGRGLLA
jgi:formiminotetrahydrofolate cyclodeaminase